MLQSLGLPIAAVIPTFDPATYLADRLSACVGARGNPFEGPLAHARFDKWAMSESVRKAGLRAVKEILVTSWTEAKDYLESLNPPLSAAKPVIIKALQSSNSQGLQKVNSIEQAEAYFRKEMGSTTQYGDKVGKVLISEFLQGKEYVVDSVSRDGVHKTVVVWNEDLRPGNGYFDLYYGFKLMDPKEPKIKAIIEYAHKVLDAAGVNNGASDMEVFWIEDEGAACVTDLNARWTALMWHDGLLLENTITGTNQITATIDALLDPEAFNKMPSMPSINQQGAILFTLPHHTGTVMDVPGLRVAKNLPSYFSSFNEGLFRGKVIEKVYNSHPAIFILLANKEKSVVENDYNLLIDLQYSDGFFDMVVAPAHTSFLALRHSGGGQQLAAISALAMVTVAATWALVTISRRKVRDHTAYVTIE
jgi:biotin carboxylase